jgi:hypothetical protein
VVAITIGGPRDVEENLTAINGWRFRFEQHPTAAKVYSTAAAPADHPVAEHEDIGDHKLNPEPKVGSALHRLR